MFTGIVQDVGRLLGVVPRGSGRRLAVATDLALETFELGESVAVNGVCLTVASRSASRGSFEADVSPETLRRSNLGSLKAGAPVNLERALRLADRLGGHLVLGHVDGTGLLTARREEGDFQRLEFRAPVEVTRYLVDKGSIAVDGVSLTVSAWDRNGFQVAVIPHTLERTNLPGRRAGAVVNLEVDILAKYVERLVGGGPPEPGVSWDLLARSGFVK